MLMVGSATGFLNQYDALGQLIRENDPFNSTAGLKGTTWVFSYDQGGNILSKTAYPFTEEETITGTAVHIKIWNSIGADTLTSQGRKFDFRDIQPTSVFGSVVNFKPAC